MHTPLKPIDLPLGEKYHHSFRYSNKLSSKLLHGNLCSVDDDNDNFNKNTTNLYSFLTYNIFQKEKKRERMLLISSYSNNFNKKFFWNYSFIEIINIILLILHSTK